MDCTTRDLDLATATPSVVFDLGGLYAALKKLSDKRKARGKRDGLALILVLFVLAKLCEQGRPFGIA